MASGITQKAVKLTKPHTHAGRDYPPNAVVTMDSDSADWLIAIGSAVPAPKGAEPASQPAA